MELQKPSLIIWSLGVWVMGLKIRSSDKATQLATLRTVSIVESHFLTSCLKPKAIISMQLLDLEFFKNISLVALIRSKV